MTIKNLLIHFAPDNRNDACLNAGASIAANFESHVVGLFTFPPPTPLVPGYELGSAAIATAINEELEAAAKTCAEWKSKFESRLSEAGTSCEWHEDRNDPRKAMVTHAHYADLAIVAQPEHGFPLSAVAPGWPADIITASGCPVLVIPYAGDFATVGKRALVAWNASKEATRAVRDSLPLLARSEKTFVFSVNPPEADHIPGAEMSHFLARHGVNVEARHTVAYDIDAADAILNAVSDVSADLLVMGAYGHSRMRELVLGGVTRHILHHMTAPVLMSH